MNAEFLGVSPVCDVELMFSGRELEDSEIPQRHRNAHVNVRDLDQMLGERHVTGEIVLCVPAFFFVRRC